MRVGPNTEPGDGFGGAILDVLPDERPFYWSPW